MVHWLTEVEDQDGEWWRIVVYANSEREANLKAKQHYRDNEGMEVWDADSELFDTFRHGDLSDYEILT